MNTEYDGRCDKCMERKKTNEAEEDGRVCKRCGKKKLGGLGDRDMQVQKGKILLKEKYAQVRKYFRDTQKQLEMLTQHLSCQRREVDLGIYLVHYKAKILP